MIMQELNKTYRRCKFRWRRQWEPDENGSKQHEVETEQHRDLRDEDQDAVMLSTPSWMNPILLLLLLLLNFPHTTASFLLLCESKWFRFCFVVEMLQKSVITVKWNCMIFAPQQKGRTKWTRNSIGLLSIVAHSDRLLQIAIYNPFFLIYTSLPFSYFIL